MRFRIAGNVGSGVLYRCVQPSVLCEVQQRPIFWGPTPTVHIRTPGQTTQLNSAGSTTLNPMGPYRALVGPFPAGFARVGRSPERKEEKGLAVAVVEADCRSGFHGFSGGGPDID